MHSSLFISVNSYCFFRLKSALFPSSLNAFNMEKTINIIITVNGKAAIIEAVCNASKPPCHSRTAAALD